MAMKSVPFSSVRDRVNPGDVIAFGGNNPLSIALKVLGDSPVSHAGLIVGRGTAGDEPRYVDSTVWCDPDDKELKYRIEIKSFRAVQEHYPGDVWWLPLSAAARGPFKEQAFSDYVKDSLDKPFDLAGGFYTMVREGLDVLPLPELVKIKQDMVFFCSQFVAEALEQGGVALGGVSSGDVSPGDLVSWTLYQNDYSYVWQTDKDQAKEIRAYNTLAPGVIHRKRRIL